MALEVATGRGEELRTLIPVPANDDERGALQGAIEEVTRLSVVGLPDDSPMRAGLSALAYQLRAIQLGTTAERVEVLETITDALEDIADFTPRGRGRGVSGVVPLYLLYEGALWAEDGDEPIDPAKIPSTREGLRDAFHRAEQAMDRADALLAAEGAPNA